MRRLLLVFGFLTCMLWMSKMTSLGFVREKRKVRYRFNFTKVLCGFPIWIEEVDIVILFLNICNVILFLSVIITKRYDMIFTDGRVVCYYLIQLLAPLLLVWPLMKEQKKPINIRETVDLQEKRGILTVGTNQTSFQYVFTTSKRMEAPTKLIVFVPDSYNNITLDAEGNISKYDAKEGWKKTYNMGAYEELSDALVRAGYATVRFAREKGEKDLVMDLVTKKEIIEAYLDRKEFDGEIILLAHGLGNTELKRIVSGRRVSGIISLCGAALGMWESYVNRGVWLGGNRKRLEKQYQNKMEYAPQTIDFLKISRSKRVQEFVEIAEELPVFLGYVEYDPYYDEQLVEEIRALEEEKIEYHYYQDTDFTLRFRRKNARKGAYVDGQEIGAGMSQLNPQIVEDIIQWQN